MVSFELDNQDPDSIDYALQRNLRVLMLYSTFCKAKIEAESKDEPEMTVEDNAHKVTVVTNVSNLIKIKLSLDFFSSASPVDVAS